MAFLQPQPSDPWIRQPIFRVPGVVVGLIAVLAAAHGARILASPKLAEQLIEQYAFIPARFGAALSQHMIGDWLTGGFSLISYMGIHDDFTHLAINCLWLLAFGPIVARRFGSLLFLGFFLVCGITGALTHLAFNWGSPMPVIGASAAISGLMAAGLRLLPSQAPWAHPGEEKLAPIFSRQIMIFTLIWVAINLLVGLTGMGLGGEAGMIAWQAHLGGYFVGLLLAGPFDRLRPRSSFI